MSDTIGVPYVAYNMSILSAHWEYEDFLKISWIDSIDFADLSWNVSPNLVVVDEYVPSYGTYDTVYLHLGTITWYYSYTNYGVLIE